MLVKTRYPKPDSGDLGAEWKEGIQIDLGSEWKGGVFARALLEEAQVLIEPRQKSGL